MSRSIRTLPLVRSALLGAAVVSLFTLAVAGQPGVGTWTNTDSLKTARASHTATLLHNGIVLVAGGFASDFSSAELYDRRTGIWTNTGNLITGRIQGHTATLLQDGSVLVAGGLGCTGSCVPVDSAELYDPGTETWTNTGNLNTARVEHTATLLHNGLVLVAGGILVGGGGVSSSAELYDPRNGTWTDTDNMNATREGHTATLLRDGMVLVVGGRGGSSAELYDPRTETWTNTDSLSTVSVFEVLSRHTATLLYNGMVMVAGGRVCIGSCVTVTSAELYDPRTGTWTDTGSLNTARVAHTATLLRNGMVLVAGGSDTALGSGNIGLDSAELYDPRTETWTNTGRLDTARTVHTATLLRNGTVLAAGGFAITFVPVPAVELFRPR